MITSPKVIVLYVIFIKKMIFIVFGPNIQHAYLRLFSNVCIVFN